jgi:hypothetical protein
MVFFKGYLWFAEFVGQKVHPFSFNPSNFFDRYNTNTNVSHSQMARIDPSTGAITEYPVPLPSLLGPGVVRATFTNPDRVCFTAILAGANGCLHIDTGKFDVYPGKGISAAVSIPGENTKDTRFNDIICMRPRFYSLLDSVYFPNCPKDFPRHKHTQ